MFHYLSSSDPYSYPSSGMQRSPSSSREPELSSLACFASDCAAGRWPVAPTRSEGTRMFQKRRLGPTNFLMAALPPRIARNTTDDLGSRPIRMRHAANVENMMDHRQPSAAPREGDWSFRWRSYSWPGLHVVHDLTSLIELYIVDHGSGPFSTAPLLQRLTVVLILRTRQFGLSFPPATKHRNSRLIPM